MRQRLREDKGILCLSLALAPNGVEVRSDPLDLRMTICNVTMCVCEGEDVCVGGCGRTKERERERNMQ